MNSKNKQERNKREEEERDLMTSRQFRATERTLEEFYHRVKMKKERVAQLVRTRNIPVHEPEDVSRAIDILLVERVGDLKFLARKQASIENDNSRFWVEFKNQLQQLYPTEGSCRWRPDRLVRGPVGQRKGEVLIPGRSRMTRECHVRFL
jgi:hypothetical protein